MRAALRRFRSDASGMTMVEVAMIMLILVPMMVSGSEIQRYLRFSRHLGAAAEGLAAIMGQRGDPLRDSNWSEDATALAHLFAEGPALGSALGVQASLVRFEHSDESCVANCTYDRARVLWTWDGGSAPSRALLNAKNLLRACGLLAKGTDTPAAATLPANLFREGRLLVVTLVHEYQPYFLTAVIGARSIVREAYAVPLQGDLSIDPFGAANEVEPCP